MVARLYESQQQPCVALAREIKFVKSGSKLKNRISRFGVSHGYTTETVANAKTADVQKPTLSFDKPLEIDRHNMAPLVASPNYQHPPESATPQ